MGVIDKGGKVYVRRRWPDGSQLNRQAPNKTAAADLLKRVEYEILIGTWPELKNRLARGESWWEEQITFKRFCEEQYIPDYAKKSNRRPEFKTQTLGKVYPILGHIPIRDIRRTHARELIAKSKGVKPATINRRLAVVSHVLTYALEKEVIDGHPLVKFAKLTEEQTAIRVPTLLEVRALIDKTSEKSVTIAAYCALLAETGLRKSEGLRLTWDAVRLTERMVTVKRSKGARVRDVPLSKYALEWLLQLVRSVGEERVFLWDTTLKRVKDPRGPFGEAKKALGLEWVGFHTLRHFRATQWVKAGIDLRTVQELLGHAHISTTMRYAHYAPDHARRKVREVEEMEAIEVAENRLRVNEDNGK